VWEFFREILIASRMRKGFTHEKEAQPGNG
jgi:hypothetical protein